MYSKSKFNFKKFFIALLSMLTAITLAFSVACKKNDSSTDTPDDDSTSTETTTTVTDYQLIKNGDFEFNTKDDSSFPYSSSINWARSLYTSVTSAPSSTGTSGIIDTADEKFTKLESKNKPSENPKTPFAFGLVENTYDADDEELRVNPQADGTKILMINNKKNGEGTAQYYRASSSISVPTAEYAVLSFWVKTLDLKSLYTANPGAHVRLTSSTGSATYEELVINNINTAGEWVKFELYFEGSEVASTTLNLTFGLGQGNGIDHNEFVEGFAFLDNVNVATIEKADYEAKSSTNIDLDITDPETINPSTNKVTFSKTIIDNEVDDSKEDNFAVYKARINFNVLTATAKSATTVNATPIKVNANPSNNAVYGYNKTLNETSDTVKEAIGSATFSRYTFMDFASPASATYETDTYTLASGEYDLVTFFAKVKTYHPDSDKLKVQILNEDNDAADVFASIDTDSLESARYGEWIAYRVFVNNPTDVATTYSLKFTFGYDGEWDDAYALQKGYAIIADLSVYSTDEDSYKLASTSDYLAKQQIYGDYVSFSDAADDTKNDSYPIVVDKTQSFTIKSTPATNVNGYSFKASDSANTLYGIINSKYYNGGKSYGNVTFEDDITGFESLTTASNKYAQVLVLDNKTESYSRFVTEVKTVSANSASKVIVKVRAFDQAVANVSIVASAYADGGYEKKEFKTSETDTAVALTSQITSASYTKGGWTYVYFYLTAGNEDISFRVEVSNESKGTILTEGVTVASIDQALISADKNALSTDFKVLGSDYDFVSKKHTQAPTTILTTGEDGETVENVKYHAEKEVYFGNGYAKFVDYSTLFADTEIDNRTDSDNSTDTETEQPEEEGYTLSTDVALQVSSIIIALVLILVILVIFIRNITKDRRRKKAKTASYYEENTGFDRFTREKTLKKIAEKKAKELEIELSDDDTEYDYSLTELMEEETSEEVELEEVVEETAEEETSEIVEEVTEEVVEETAEEEKPQE